MSTGEWRYTYLRWKGDHCGRFSSNGTDKNIRLSRLLASQHRGGEKSSTNYLRQNRERIGWDDERNEITRRKTGPGSNRTGANGSFRFLSDTKIPAQDVITLMHQLSPLLPTIPSDSFRAFALLQALRHHSDFLRQVKSSHQAFTFQDQACWHVATHKEKKVQAA
jgi:hypothetical protein